MKYRSVLYFISLSLAFVMLASSCGRKAAPADGTTASGGADDTVSVTSADTEASGAALPAAQPAEPAEETEPPAPAAPASPWDGYTIVRSDLASDDVIQTVIALRKALLEKGIDIPLATDFVGWNETAPVEYQILLLNHNNLYYFLQNQFLRKSNKFFDQLEHYYFPRKMISFHQ